MDGHSTSIQRPLNVYAISRQNVVNNSSRFRVVPVSSDIKRCAKGAFVDTVRRHFHAYTRTRAR